MPFASAPQIFNIKNGWITGISQRCNKYDFPTIHNDGLFTAIRLKAFAG